MSFEFKGSYRTDEFPYECENCYCKKNPKVIFYERMEVDGGSWIELTCVDCGYVYKRGL